MKDLSKKNIGLIMLTRQCKENFKIPENLNHYSEKDYKKAERKYIKYVLTEQTT
jgi:hypothetical protein